jgi:hypothetical protein
MVSYRVCLQVLPASLQARVPISAVLWLRVSEHLVNRHRYTWGARGPQQSRAVECRAPSFLLYQRSYFKREWLWQKMTVAYCAHWYVKTPFQILHLSSSTFLNVYSNAHFLLGHFKLCSAGFCSDFILTDLLPFYPIILCSESPNPKATQPPRGPPTRTIAASGIKIRTDQNALNLTAISTLCRAHGLGGNTMEWHETGTSQWMLFLSFPIPF